MLKIEDFQKKDIDELVEVLRYTFKNLVCPSYSAEKREFAEEIILDEFSNSHADHAKVARICNEIKAGAVLKGDSIFPVYHLSALGEQSVREIVRHMENLSLDSGNNELNIYALMDRYKTYIEPFRGENYAFHFDVDYPLDDSSLKNSLQVIRMRKTLNL